MILNVSEAGDGPPLLLLHGLFGAARNLGLISRAFANSYRVYALDLRNHGESPHSDEMDYPIMAQDVAETMAHLGLGSVRLCGHSMGGKVAMMLALSSPELVERLAVMDIAPVAYDHDYSDYAQAMKSIELSPTLTRGEADHVLSETIKAAPLRAFFLNNLVLGSTPRWRLGLDEISANMENLFRWDDPPNAAPYEGETLFLCGAESNYVRPEAEPAIMQRFPHARIERVAGATHWLHADKPEQVVTALREFFAS